MYLKMEIALTESLVIIGIQAEEEEDSLPVLVFTKSCPLTQLFPMAQSHYSTFTHSYTLRCNVFAKFLFQDGECTSVV